MVTPKEVRQWLQAVRDPEIPHVSIVDMGMVGEVTVEGEKVRVELIPTYAGCPAIKLLQAEIQAVLASKGLEAEVEVNYQRPWRAEAVTPAGWAGLRRAGFALPKHLSGDPDALFADISCPRCGSTAVSLSTPFGPTACRAIFRCHNCGEAFELFKPPV
ncbi:MAG: phenylacetate-CoA oxygenase subunit PaaJ [Bacteroidia bacterium]|nr:phenylacetate-CoA oxygenase subunit PaaJ [Bacteroidia bacterium]MDW8088285.1 1,2-phenylacetyl-CoA epoxidase subunit PaaD [Bacteroidia bacterium]